MTLIFSACGFNLRGSQSNTQKIDQIQLAFDEDISLSLRQNITLAFEQNNIKINNNAAYKLTIQDNDRNSFRVASSRTALTDRYILRYTLNSVLSNGDQQWPLSHYQERIFDDDQNSPSAKTRERNDIRRALEQQAVAKLVAHVYGFNPQ